MKESFQNAEIRTAQFCPLDALFRVGSKRLEGLHEYEPDMDAGGVLHRSGSSSLHQELFIDENYIDVNIVGVRQIIGHENPSSHRPVPSWPDSFVAATVDRGADRALDPAKDLSDLLEAITLADEVGLDVFGIGEHHRREFLDSAPAVILAAAAARTRRIRLTSAVTVLSAADPVRVLQEFATLDLLSQGRAGIVAGRGSFIEAFPLYGLELDDYDSLFTGKLDLLLNIRENTHVHWSGKHRAALTGQGVYPRPLQNPLPIWLGVGGTPGSFARAGRLGLPLMVAIIGGESHRFAPLIDRYRHAGLRAGVSPDRLKVGIHSLGYVAESAAKAADDFFPGYARSFSEIGKERGWAPVTRAHFNALLGPTGALLVGDPETVVEKILRMNESLGGISRLTFQMSVAALPHTKLMRAIEILGTRVAPPRATRGNTRDAANRCNKKLIRSSNGLVTLEACCGGGFPSPGIRKGRTTPVIAREIRLCKTVLPLREKAAFYRLWGVVRRSDFHCATGRLLLPLRDDVFMLPTRGRSP